MENIVEYCKTGNTLYVRKVSQEIKEFILKIIPHVLKKYTDENNIYRFRSIELMDVLTKPEFEDQCIDKIKGLKWTGNICYLDSVLICLFVIKCNFINEYILNAELVKRNGTLLECFHSEKISDSEKSIMDLENRKNIQNELKNISNNIRNGEKQKCSTLRKYLKNCRGAKLFYGTQMAESGEFLTYLFNIFDTNVAVKKTITYGTNNIDLIQTSTIIDDKASVIHFIPSDTLRRLLKTKYYELRSFLTIKDDSGILDDDNQYKDDNGIFYKRRITYNTIIDTPYLVFRVDRLWLNNFYQIKIIPSQIITLANLNQFALSSVIVFRGLHYTCYFRCGNKWYYYDDTDNDIELVGSYNTMLNTKKFPNVITNGTVYFYIRI